VIRGVTRRWGAAPAMLLAGAVLLLATVEACGSPTVPENAPANHTDFKGGAAHAPGGGDATVNCVECHGADLRGGDNGEPSCFTCHGQEWR
jgi:hypothetical protein